MAQITLPVGTGLGHAAVKYVRPQLRRASADDGAEILAIYNESILRGEIARHGRELTMAELPDTILPDDDRYQTYVALVDGVVRGWAGFRPWHQRLAYASTLELLVYVAPEHRARGLGRALVAHVLAVASRNGYRSMLTLSPADDAVAARLWQSTGFFISGALSAVFPGPERLHDVMMYQRMLVGDEAR
jgi:L-amino acid N-acyltransferase YncA